MATQRAIGKWGTAGRIGLGALFFWLAFSNLTLTEYSTPSWYAFVLGFIGFPVALLTFQRIRLRFTDETLKATGQVGFCGNFAVGAALFLTPFTREAALLFYGVSLLLAAARGYAGCEILAISNWLLRRDDQVGCVISPLDEMESRLTGQARG